MARSPHSEAVSRLMLFFAIVYTVEGIGQAKVGVIWQPLTHFLKELHGWTTVQISISLAVLDIPWMIKPFYGAVSDFLPLFGYRRRSYLLIANLAAIAAFIWVAQVTLPGPVITALVVTSAAMAISSTLCGALLVENGQRLKASAGFVNQQWLWFNVAVMIATLLGGVLVEVYSATSALHLAAWIAAAAPLAVLCSLALVDETRSGTDRSELRRRLTGFTATFRSRTLGVIALFLFCYYFRPGFGTPLYFYMTDTLRFSQTFIGLLSSASAAGWIAGGLLYRWALTRMGTERLLRIGILSGTAGTLLYLGLTDPTTAVVIYFVNGVAGMVANIATLSLAADHCPPYAEGFAFAALMSVMNVAAPLSDTLGAVMYEHLFDNELAPLILVSAASGAIVLLMMRMIDLRDWPLISRQP